MMIHSQRPFFVARLAALLLWVLQFAAGPAGAGEAHPLRPIDTSSPRSTLQGFLEFMNEGYAMGYGRIQAYLASSQLYLSPEDLAAVHGTQDRLESAQRTLDLSELAPATAHESARRIVIQLKEVLDRIDVPPIESVPDAPAMAAAEFKRWTLPGSEIRITRVETGPRAGEYLFSPETVSRLPDFYLKVQALPYKPGASAGWYGWSQYVPTGVALALEKVVPPRWVLNVPQWTQATFIDQPLWRWFGIVAVFAGGFAVVLFCYRLSRYWAARGTSAGRWADLLRPFSLVLVTPVVALILADVLRISGAVYQVVTLSLWTLFFLTLTWMVWVVGGAVAESMIAHERLRISSIDSQLIRLVLRLLTIVLAIAILVAGADRVGLPAYSVLAGLGVGGLAVALAAQQTLANLLGSIIIMIEKPFAIGHWIKLKDIEGTVEAIGFRSTRIRTFYDSLVTIPSSQLVSSTIDNMELRSYRQVKTVLNLTYDTPTGKIEDLVVGMRSLLQAHPDVRKDNVQVMFNDLGPHSLDILMNFFLKVPDKMSELAARQSILLDILRLAERMGVRFAFPTQTLHIESMPENRQALADEPAANGPGRSGDVDTR